MVFLWKTFPLTPFLQLNYGIEFSITFGHIIGMKTAISIPDEIFEEVEKYSKEHRYSRSEVVVRAVREFFGKIEIQRAS